MGTQRTLDGTNTIGEDVKPNAGNEWQGAGETVDWDSPLSVVGRACYSNRGEARAVTARREVHVVVVLLFVDVSFS